MSKTRLTELEREWISDTRMVHEKHCEWSTGCLSRPRVKASSCRKPNNHHHWPVHPIPVIHPFIVSTIRTAIIRFKLKIKRTSRARRLTSDFSGISTVDWTLRCVFHSLKVWHKGPLVFEKNKDDLWVGRNPNQTRKNYGKNGSNDVKRNVHVSCSGAILHVMLVHVCVRVGKHQQRISVIFGIGPARCHDTCTYCNRHFGLISSPSEWHAGEASKATGWLYVRSTTSYPLPSTIQEHCAFRRHATAYIFLSFCLEPTPVYHTPSITPTFDVTNKISHLLDDLDGIHGS